MANPLTVEKLQTDTCSGLATAQLTSYIGAIRQQVPKENVARTPTCTWLSVDGDSPAITLYADSKARGVADLYEKRLGDNFFEKIPLLAGYPAIRRSAKPDGPQVGDCMTIVAVSEQATITIFANTIGKNYQYYTSMCTVSDKLAEAAVENLKARG